MHRNRHDKEGAKVYLGWLSQVSPPGTQLRDASQDEVWFSLACLFFPYHRPHSHPAGRECPGGLWLERHWKQPSSSRQSLMTQQSRLHDWSQEGKISRNTENIQARFCHTRHFCKCWHFEFTALGFYTAYCITVVLSLCHLKYRTHHSHNTYTQHLVTLNT